MAFVEAVACELCHQLEDLGGLLRIDAAADGALGEDLALRLHLGRVLLAHRPPQQIGATQRVARHLLGDLHHVFLVDDDAVALGQDVVDLRMRRLGDPRVLAPAIFRDAGHRTGTIQRNGGDQILEPVGLHLAQHVAHALAFHLEHPAGVPLPQHLKRLPVVERQQVHVDIDAKPRQQSLGALQDGQRGQAEEVELHEPGLLNMLHRVLRDQKLRARITIQRHQLLQWPIADHHAGGVCRGMSIQPLQLQRDLQQTLDALVLIAQLGQPRLAIDRLLQRHRGRGNVGDQLGNAVHLAERQAEHAAHVAHHRPRLQLAEGDDLRHPVGAVFIAHIVDDGVAAFRAEVDVEIRHRHALGVQEPLEQQIETDRIDIGDGQRPGSDGTGARAAARADRNALPLRPLDEIRNDQEISGKPHAGDDTKFVLQPLAIARTRRRIGLDRVHAAIEALVRHRPHGLFLAAAGPHLG